MTITLYGIPNCDTVKKARAWLVAQGHPHAFHDYKKLGIDAAQLRAWCDTLGWEVLLNKSGTTFRALPEPDKAGLDIKKAIQLMLAQPSMIKRPILTYPDGVLVGFKPETWAKALQ